MKTLLLSLLLVFLAGNANAEETGAYNDTASMCFLNWFATYLDKDKLVLSHNCVALNENDLKGLTCQEIVAERRKQQPDTVLNLICWSPVTYQGSSIAQLLSSDSNADTSFVFNYVRLSRDGWQKQSFKDQEHLKMSRKFRDPTDWWGFGPFSWICDAKNVLFARRRIYMLSKPVFTKDKNYVFIKAIRWKKLHRTVSDKIYLFKAHENSWQLLSAIDAVAYDGK